MKTSGKKLWFKVIALSISLMLLLSMFVTTGIGISGAAIPEWQPNTDYAKDALVTYSGKTYQCIAAHKSLDGWQPPNVPALWKESTGPVTPPSTPVVVTPTVPPGGQTFTISGVIKADVTSNNPAVNAGFKVEASGMSTYGISDNNGYFTLSGFPPVSANITLKITKTNHLRREIQGIRLSGHVTVGSANKPVQMWAGDMVIDGKQDDAINMSDIVELITSYNTSVGNPGYKAESDFNMDNAINMEDILIIINHFNKSMADYQQDYDYNTITYTPVPTSSMTTAPTSTPTNTIPSTYTPTPTPTYGTPPPPAQRMYVGYAGTWNTSIYDLDPKNIPNYFTHVNLAFARPDTTYQKGSYAFDQAVAGFEFVEGATTFTGQKKFTPQQVQDFKNIIAALKARGTEVWVSIGGWAYSQGSQWANFNAPHVVDLALDLGATGIDVDWESSGSTVKKGPPDTFSCSKDGEIKGIVSSLYNEIKSRGVKMGISIAGWSTGAYYVLGTPFEEGKVQWGSPFGGTMYRVVKDNGHMLSHINLMSYDGGEYYDPREGYEAYRAIYDGPINVGIEIAPEGSGGAVLKLNAEPGSAYDGEMLTGQNNMASKYYNVETLVNYVKNKGKPFDGFMIWQIWKQRVHQPAPAGAATENSAGQYICRNLPLRGDPNQTIPSLPPLKP
ncbi:MAG: glycosyl hydrolase family 18 protein [Clostridia bacterium]|nr:glycosyl hydrolase family 18 protein [Clostridia bacterium]